MTLLACQAVAPPPSAASPLLDQRAPSIDGHALDGSSVSSASLRGRPVIVEFFAEHCKPCLKSLPELERLRQSAPELSIVGVSEDEEQAAAARLSSGLGLGFPVIHDPGHVLAGRFRVSDLPATVVIDALGTLRWKGERAHDAAELRAVADSVR